MMKKRCVSVPVPVPDCQNSFPSTSCSTTASPSSSPSTSPSSTCSSSSCVVDLIDRTGNNDQTLLNSENLAPATIKNKRKNARKTVACASDRVNQSADHQAPNNIKKRKRNSNKSLDDNVVGKRNTCSSNSNGNSNRRSSVYRGVTRHRWTGRFEAHLWDKGSWNTVQNKKGKQVYLGAYDCEDDAARTYDLAALKYWGPETTLNFPIENYAKELEEMQSSSREEYLASLRRRSSGFSRGVSKYRGVARHHHNGRWEARIGRVFGNKYLYLGTFSSQEEAAMAYDLAAIEYRGTNAVTNFDITNYIGKAKNLSLSAPDNKEDEDPLSQQQQTPLTVCPNKRLVPIDNNNSNDPATASKPPQPQVVINQSSKEQPLIINTMDGSVAAAAAAAASSSSSTSMLQVADCSDHCDTNAAGDHDHLHPWSFCLDDSEVAGDCYDHHPSLLDCSVIVVPHVMPFEEDTKLLDLFDQAGFDDDIHLIFEEPNSNINSITTTNLNLPITTTTSTVKDHQQPSFSISDSSLIVSSSSSPS